MSVKQINQSAVHMTDWKAKRKKNTIRSGATWRVSMTDCWVNRCYRLHQHLRYADANKQRMHSWLYMQWKYTGKRPTLPHWPSNVSVFLSTCLYKQRRFKIVFCGNQQHAADNVDLVLKENIPSSHQKHMWLYTRTIVKCK